MHPTESRPRGLSEPGAVLSQKDRADRVATSVVLSSDVLFEDERLLRCDICELPIENRQAAEGSGLYVWVRGGEVRYEEPPLCATCGPLTAMIALRRFEEEDEAG